MGPNFGICAIIIDYIIVKIIKPCFHLDIFTIIWPKNKTTVNANADKILFSWESMPPQQT